MIPLVLFLWFFLFPHPVGAVYDPLSVPNNKYGIHIADFNDLPDIPALVNSSGGDWGYVTLVASDNDRDNSSWQEMFNRMRRLHLVPIVRLATHPVGATWAKPDTGKFNEIVNFFTKLNWPTENRYVILYNEPNHANEWGGALNPEEYARDFVLLARALKAASPDFFIMSAGLDVSADGEVGSLDAATFWRRVINEKPEILDLIDGLASHSYPNPGFSGSPYASGRGTLRSWQWELNLLRGLGLKKDLPMFITETGWAHSSGKTYLPQFLPESAVSQNIPVAASVWSDQQIAAVTPFVFSYQGEPFDHFSWKAYQSSDFYNQYYIYQGLPKIRGEPRQHEVFNFTPQILPSSLVAGSTYNLSVQVTNSGQSILSSTDYELTLDDPQKAIEEFFADTLPLVEPGEKGTLGLHFKTAKIPGSYPVIVKFHHRSREIELFRQNLVLVPPPSAQFTVQLGWKKTSSATDVKVLIYDEKNTLIEKVGGLMLKSGRVDVSGLTDIVPGARYRIVVIVPFYLPRQEIKILNKQVTEIEFKRFLPLDFDGDGGLTLKDFLALLQTKPNAVISRFVSP